MPSLINGTGTGFYGRARERADGSYVTTKFFVLFHIPLIPLETVRAQPVGRPLEVSTRRWFERSDLRSQSYRTWPEPFDAVQALTVYFHTLCWIAGIALVFFVVLPAVAIAVTTVLSGPELAQRLWGGGILAAVVLGGIGIWYAMMRGRRARTRPAAAVSIYQLDGVVFVDRSGIALRASSLEEYDQLRRSRR